MIRILPIILALAVLPQAGDRSGLASVDGIVVEESSGSPLQGVEVTFAPEGGTSRTAVSGEDGKFKIDSLIPGRYLIIPARAGFHRLRQGGGPANLTLAPDEKLSGVRLRLQSGAVVTGRVIGEDGLPIADATVRAVKPEYQNGRRLLMPCYPTRGASVKTDDGGNYRLFGLEPGNYYIGAAVDKTTCASSYHPGVDDPADAVVLTLKAGQETGGIEIRPQPQLRYSVSFKVDAPAAPESRFPVLPQVQIVRLSRNGLVTSESLTVHRSDDSAVLHGAFKSRPLSRGSYELYYDNMLGQIGRLAFEITDKDVDAGTMVIKPAVAILGRVRAVDSIPDGWTYTKTRVVLRPMDARDRLMSVRLSILNNPAPDGTFILAYAPNTGSTDRPGTVAEGRYLVSLSGLVQDQYLASARYGAAEVMDSRFVVDGSQPEPLELTIRNGGRIEGFVRNVKNEPAADSRVALIPSPDRRSNLNLFKTAFSDQSGQFSIRGVAPGEYTVLAWENVESGAWENPEFIDAFQTRMTRISVSAGLTSTITVRPIEAN